MKKGIGLLTATLVVCLCADAFSRMGQITERARPHERDIDTLEIVTESEEYAVLSAFIKSRLKPNQHWSPPACVEIFRSCGGFGAGTIMSAHKSVTKRDTLLSYSAALDYGEKNSRKWRWDARFDIGCEYRWFDYGHPSEESCESGFDFSRVGIDSTKTQAVFQLGTYYMGHPQARSISTWKSATASGRFDLKSSIFTCDK